MISIRSLTFALLIGVFVSACSSPAETSTKPSRSNAKSASPAVTGQNTAPNTDAVNTQQPANVRGGRSFTNKTIVSNPSGTPPPPQFRPAGENSAWAVTMNPDGSVVEMRVFKDNPQLARVEATSRGTNQKQVKFYLRSGQVVDVETDRLGNLKTVSTADLLALAGLK